MSIQNARIDELDRQLDEVITERDLRSDVIDRLLDLVLGIDRNEWSSQYGFEDAIKEVEQRLENWEPRTQKSQHLEVNSLMPEQLALKAELEAAKTIVDLADGAYQRLMAKCSHAYRNVDDAAVCAICGDRNGWWCPDNPTGLCKYERGSEWCVYCGSPDERK